jgi:hypothetical protein
MTTPKRVGATIERLREGKGMTQAALATRELNYPTSKLVLSSPRSMLFSHVTMMGQRPGVVLEPTRHVQLTRPELVATFGISPFALDGPDL